MLEHLQAFDPELARPMQDELARQLNKLEMIASENFTSEAVREAAGSVLTHKYAEGFPGKRYYGGCECVDEVETLAIDRAKSLFGAEYANVQPHSGSTANQVAYFGVLEPGDKVMGMSLDQGGHLTHGMKLNFSGKLFKFVHYGVDPETELIDYDNVAKIARENSPKLIVAGYTAYTRVLDFARFRAIADEVGAMLMVDMAHFSGLVASGAHPSPVPHADIVTSTTHKTLRGPRSGIVLAKEQYGARLNKALFPGLQGGPLCHIVAGKAVAFKEAMQPGFKVYIDRVIANARALGKALEAEGLRMVSGGTDNHMLLVDLTPLKLTGKAAEVALDEAGITCNKNQIPYDKQSPVLTSGVRLGTPALTTRGMTEADMGRVAAWIGRVLNDPDNADLKRTIAGEVKAFTEAYPLHVPVGEMG